MISCLFALIIAIALSVAMPAAAGAEPRPAMYDDAPAAGRLLELLNAERTSAGAPALTPRDDVVAIAAAFSRTMAEEGGIRHNREYLSQETLARLDADKVGENVAWAATPESAHKALMDSPSHRANILDPAFTVIGIGAVRLDSGILVITQDFLTPRPSRAAAASASGHTAPQAIAPAPAPVPAPAPARPRPIRPAPVAPATVPGSTAAPAPASPAPAETPPPPPPETVTELGAAAKGSVRAPDAAAPSPPGPATPTGRDAGDESVLVLGGLALLVPLAAGAAGRARHRAGRPSRPFRGPATAPLVQNPSRTYARRTFVIDPGSRDLGIA